MRCYFGLGLAFVASVTYGQVWDATGHIAYQRPAMPGEAHPGPDHRDDGYAFCLLRYTSDRSEQEGSGWTTDYPLAGQNFAVRVGELLSVRSTENQWVVDVGGQELYLCPFVTASDVGTMSLSEDEAQNLQTYLRKGGVLWVDDFWGPAAWDQWLRELGKFSARDWRIVTPNPEHPMFGMHFAVMSFQVSNVRRWLSVGDVRERGDESPETPLRVLVDADDDIKVIMTFNTDIQDTWEQEAASPAYFAEFSPRGYALGINLLLYVMTH